MTKSVVWVSCKLLSCAGAQNPAVIICLTDPFLTAPYGCPDSEQVSPFAFHTIDGTLTKVIREQDGCNICYKYVISYDEAQLNDPDTALLSSQISGVICRDCLTTWVEDKVGDQSTLIDNGDGTATFTNQYGCEYTINTGGEPTPVCVTDSQSIDFDIDGGGCVTGDVNISADAGNAVSVHSDGLFVPTGTGSGWLLIGNAGTTAGTNFLGTTDNVAFELHVNNLRALLVNPSIDSDNAADIIFGHPSNIVDVASAGMGSSILGGGFDTQPNSILTGAQGASSLSVIVSGINNTIQNAAYLDFIGTGQNQIITFAANGGIVAGQSNEITAQFPIVGGGSFCAFIGGGSTNVIRDSEYSAILGGLGNEINNAIRSSILGGESLKIGTYSTGFQGHVDNSVRDVSAFTSIAYFGDVDLWVSNSSGTAKKLKLIEPNTDLDFSSANYTSFQAQAQSANIEYVMPASIPTPGQVLTVDTVVGSVVTLKWA